jgi:CheY-like chemotaxis protein
VILFEIEDTGPGIAPEEMDNLFEAFGQTASGRGAREGTGLGLLISNKFVQLMGGHMNVASEVGKGTTFAFDIRAQMAGEVDILTEPPTRRVVALEPGQPNYRLLIVDDRRDNRQLLIRMLGPLGFALREAGNGQEAIEIWETWKPHLIWMDMRMPVMDGYEATKRIRAQDTAVPTPVIIAVTASVFEENRAAVMSIGCDDIVIKPYTESEIIEMLQKYLGVRFQYADDELREEAFESEGARPAITPPDLTALSREMVARLKRSVTALEMDTTLIAIEEIRKHDESLADVLKKLVKEYRFDKLLKLLEKENEG